MKGEGASEYVNPVPLGTSTPLVSGSPGAGEPPEVGHKLEVSLSGGVNMGSKDCN